MKNFLNATQHVLTAEQKAAVASLSMESVSIQELKDVDSDLFSRLANISADASLPELADALIAVMEQFDAVHLPIGSPAFQFVLARKCASLSTTLLFSHSVRQVVEEPQPDGSVVKKTVFKFEKFITV